MNPNKIAMLEARRRWQAGLLPAFDEIAQVCLCIVRGAGKSGKIFADLQSYLDSTITINGASYRRRSVVLAIHDMTGETEAPAMFQSKTLAQFLRLKVYPIPQLKFYQDIATALLRIEVIMRLSAKQELEKAESELALAPVRGSLLARSQPVDPFFCRDGFRWRQELYANRLARRSSGYAVALSGVLCRAGLDGNSRPAAVMSA